ncbi:MAG TPA: hypothetical protein VN043_08990 [Rhodanobacter sp.]|nr:hypothetical protein [Rhodanobacter sp.]
MNERLETCWSGFSRDALHPGCNNKSIAAEAAPTVVQANPND